MVFTTADIIVIALILIFAFSGLIKGFVRTVISFCKGALSLLIAYFLAPHCATFLSGTGIYNVINKFLLGGKSSYGYYYHYLLSSRSICK